MAKKISVRINTALKKVGRGRPLTVQVQVTGQNRKPVAGYCVLPYVNHRRWGAHEFTDRQGRAVLRFPLPSPGLYEVCVAALPGISVKRDPAPLFVGEFLPARARASNSPSVRVLRRKVVPPPKDPGTDVCMQFESWFVNTTNNKRMRSWGTAYAVPVLGFYDSFNREVARQHILWFIELGVDVILSDWSNHLWDRKHWSEIGGFAKNIVLATGILLEVLAEMKQEGLKVPKLTLLLGISNGPPCKVSAINEELAWLYHNFIQHPRFSDLWYEYEGKPLMVLLDTAAIGHPQGFSETLEGYDYLTDAYQCSHQELAAHRARTAGKIDDTHFTLRYMSTQLQDTRHDQLGYWSWMDGEPGPTVTYKNGRAEVCTAAVGYFGRQGWTGPQTRGRQGGATLLKTFKTALESRPRILQLHQFNEFTGRREGAGHGPNRDVYVDSYSMELSDDFEPVSLTAPAYRGNGGWGYFYHNLHKALLGLYAEKKPVGTVLVVSCPIRGSQITGKQLQVSWEWLGRTPRCFSLYLNGRKAASGLQGNSTVLALKARKGPVAIKVVAEGTKSWYLLSYEDDVERLSRPVPAQCEVTCTLV